MRYQIVSALLGISAVLAGCTDQRILFMTLAGGQGGSTTDGPAGFTSVAGRPGSGGAAGGATGSGGTYTPVDGACAPLPISSACSQNPVGPVTPQTMQEYAAAISGRWLVCSSHESVFGVDGGDVGLEITLDNHWYKLFSAPGGATIRGAGFGEEGTWTALGNSQLNLEILGSGTVITSPVLASTPRAMRLSNNGVFQATYVIDDSVPTGASRCMKAVDSTRSGACTPPSDAMIVCASDDPSVAVRGRWSRCGGSMPGAPPHDGIEFAADGTFYFLHYDPLTALVRGTADTDHGTASFDPVFKCQSTTSLQTPSGTSWLSTSTFFDSSPRQFWIYTSPEWGDPERYTFIGP